MCVWLLALVLLASTGSGQGEGDDAATDAGDMGAEVPALKATIVRKLDGAGQHRHLLTTVALAPMPRGCELAMLENLSNGIYVDSLDWPAITPPAAARIVFERPDIEAPTVTAMPQLVLVWLPPSVFESRPYGDVELAMPVHTRYQMPPCHPPTSNRAAPAPFVLAAPVIYTRCIIDQDSPARDLDGTRGGNEAPCSGISSGPRSLVDCAAELSRAGWSPVFVDGDAGEVVLTGVPAGQRDDLMPVLIVTVGSVLAAAAWLAAGIKQNAGGKKASTPARPRPC